MAPNYDSPKYDPTGGTVPVTNPDDRRNLYVAGVCIPPNETRLLPRHEVPRKYWPASPEAVADKPMDERQSMLHEILVKGASPVKFKVNKLVPALPDLGDDDLQRIAEMENAHEKPRKSVLKRIEELLLERAAARELEDSLNQLTDEQLQAHRETVLEAPEELAIVDKLLAARGVQVGNDPDAQSEGNEGNESEN